MIMIVTLISRGKNLIYFVVHSSANTGVPSVLVITALLAAALKLSF